MMIAQKYKEANKELVNVIRKKDSCFFYLGVFFLLVATLSAGILALLFLDATQFLKH